MSKRLLLPCFGLLLCACSEIEGNGSPGYAVDPATIDVSRADYCDITQPRQCLFPFPNDFFTTQDGTSATGIRIHFDPRAMPQNAAGDPFDVSEHNRNDGFSPGPTLLAHVPGVDLAQTGAATITAIDRSLPVAAPIQLLHAATGERQLIWAELDAYPQPEQARALLIRVAANLQEGERYIAVLQNLRNANGERLEAEAAFAVYRDAIPSSVPELEQRRAHFEALFKTLQGYGIQRSDLYLSWDFTVASTDNLTARMLHMRDIALADLAGDAPAASVTSVIDTSPGENPYWARTVRGTFEAPNFMDSSDAGPGSRLYYPSLRPDALPDQRTANARVDVPFLCAIPHSAIADAANGSTDTRVIIMGHGLFGSRDSLPQMGPMAEQHKLLMCAVDSWGMSRQDIPVVFSILSNISLFPTLADRLQQSFLNTILLSELIVNAAGFAASPVFQNDAGLPLFRTGEVHYEGVSQGAVLGGALAAVNPYFERAVLNVAGMNFSFLISRSSAWSAFAAAFDPAYPDPLDKPLAFALIQMLWDRGENNGYANHITDSILPGSTPTRLLIHTAVGDQTVNETTAEILARTVAAQRHNPTVVSGRHIATLPYSGIAPITTYPHIGSGLMAWDSGPFPINGHAGTPLQRLDNLPQTQGYNPHSMPFRQADAQRQKAVFWRTGQIVNVCGALPCLGDGYDGTPDDSGAMQPNALQGGE